MQFIDLEDAATMAAIENILAWAKHEQERLTHQLELLQSGRLLIVEKHAHSPGWLEIDMTAQSVELCRQYLSELSAIIAQYPEIEPTHPAAPPVPRFVPPAPPTQRHPDPRELIAKAGLLHSQVQHVDWAVGWGVVKGQPPSWSFAGIYPTHAEADEAAAKAGAGYYARWGSYNSGSKEFTSGPQFDTAGSL